MSCEVVPYHGVIVGGFTAYSYGARHTGISAIRRGLFVLGIWAEMGASDGIFKEPKTGLGGVIL